MEKELTVFKNQDRVIREKATQLEIQNKKLQQELQQYTTTTVSHQPSGVELSRAKQDLKEQSDQIKYLK